jgi:DNA-directed RNA polymerase subunit RPC12/RpoP
MKYRKEYFCSECEKVVSWETKMGSLGLCPHCGFCSSGTVMKTGERAVEVQPGPVYVAWTIVKLKVVRALLRPLLKLHVWYISRDNEDTAGIESPSGPDARMEYLIAMAKKGRRT